MHARGFTAQDGPDHVTVATGERVAGEHDLVERYPDAFESEDTYRRREQLRSAAQNPGSRGAGAAFHASRNGDRADTGPGGELREQALRANERAELLPENCREDMERTVREGSDDDPDHLFERYIVTASDRDYLRAFSKLMNDPVSGAHLWSPEEREAVQNAKTLQRSLTLSTSGTAGGFRGPLRARPADPDLERRR